MRVIFVPGIVADDNAAPDADPIGGPHGQPECGSVVDALADGLPKHELPHDQADALSDALAERVPECGRGPRLRRVAGRHSGIAVLQAGVQGRSIVEGVPQVYPGVLRHVDGSRRGSLLDVRRGEAHCGAERKSDVLTIRVDRA